MGLTATVTGFVVFLLSVPVVQGLSDLGVTYAYTQICKLKGSTVVMPCTYRYPSSKDGINIIVVEQFWYIQAYKGLKTDSDYAGRTEYIFHEKNCTLRITDLRQSDSATYYFRFITNKPGMKWTGQPGVQLSVTAIQMKVTRITVNSQSYTEAELNCNSSCSPDNPLSYVWLKNGQNVLQGSSSYTGRFSPGDNISCALTGHEGYPSPSLYALKVPSVSVSPSGEIVEGSSVNLTCSSEANIVANYTWYKKNPLPNNELLNIEPQLVFRSIQSADSGEYYCTAENELGRRTSEYVSINVKYAPKTSSMSVSPSGEVVEGSSVNLTCSSDANPAANYTWYKENQTLSNGPEGTYNFTSISSEDRGIYHCKSENQYGQINSSSLFLDVQYPPRVPSVSVSPSGEIVEGSSVTLTCSSNANPAANYNWYKENEDSIKASGQIFTITDFRPEHSGNYYCEAQNRRGRHNSTLHLIVVAGVWTLIEVGTITAILTVIILFFVLLWIRKKMAPKRPSEPIERPDKNAQEQPPEHKDNLHYASIRFCKRQEDPLYANTRPAHLQRHRREEDAGSVMYATVKFTNDSPAPKSQETGADPAASNSAENHENQNV